MSEKTKQLAPVEVLKNNIEAMKPQFVKSLPSHVKPEKFVRAIQNAVMNTKDLVNIERNSFYSACMKSAELGLMPNGKEAAIVPYKGTATYIPMYEGLLKLVRNSGEIKSIVTELVYSKENFEYWIDEDGPHLKHNPKFRDRGNLDLVYCVVTTKDGAAYIEVMTMEDIEKVKAASRAQNGPWKTWPEEMMKKSVFRRLFKRLPKSSDLDQDLLERSLEADQEMDFRDVGSSGEVKAKPVQQSRLKGMLGMEAEVNTEAEIIPSDIVNEAHAPDSPPDETPMPDVIDVPANNPNIPI